MFNFSKLAVLQKTYTSTRNLKPLAVSEQRSKIVILDTFQLVLLKHCLYKFCHLIKKQSNTIYTFLYLRTTKIDWIPSVLISNGGLVSKCYFVLIFVYYNLFRSLFTIKATFQDAREFTTCFSILRNGKFMWDVFEYLLNLYMTWTRIYFQQRVI